MTVHAPLYWSDETSECECGWSWSPGGVVILHDPNPTATIDAARQKAWLRHFDSLDAAWAEAEAALPEGWHLCELNLHCHASNTAEDRGGWLVEAHDDNRWEGETGEGPTPAAALRALAAKLRESAA